HDGIEALQERLLAKRSLQCAGLDVLELLGSEVEAVGADLAVELELRNGVADRWRDDAVRPEEANDVPAAFDELHDRGRSAVRNIDPDVVGSRVDPEVLQSLGGLEGLDRRLKRRCYAIVDLDIADRHGVREQYRAAFDVVLHEAFDKRFAADRGRRGILSGVADLAAI